MVETFVCIDKYLLMDRFDRDFRKYLRGKLDMTNCVPVFNQLVSLENAPQTFEHCVWYMKTIGISTTIFRFTIGWWQAILLFSVIFSNQLKSF